MEDLERGVREEERRRGVETRVRGAPEVGEREGAQEGPAAAEEEVVRDGAEESGRVPLDVADIQGLEEEALVQCARPRNVSKKGAKYCTSMFGQLCNIAEMRDKSGFFDTLNVLFVPCRPTLVRS